MPDFKSKSEETKTGVSYTFEAFRQKKNIMAYVDVMRRMLLKILGFSKCMGEGGDRASWMFMQRKIT